MLFTVLHFNAVTAFGLISVSLMLLFYAMENRSPWYVLAFAASCLMASGYAFLQGAWPFGLAEVAWSIIAVRRWNARRNEPEPPPAPIPTNVADFLNELSTLAIPAGRGDFTFTTPDGHHDGTVQFIINSPLAITIHRIWSAKPGNGAGSRMMRTLANLADRHGVEIRLKVVPIGRKPYPFSRDQLFAWYQRHGFSGNLKKMVRFPRPSPTRIPERIHRGVSPDSPSFN